jgi:DNA methylase
MRGLPESNVDLVVTDPPYGYSFMGKDWDKSVPSVDVWREALRVLKPGAFAFIMSAPRQDVLSQMIVRIGEAGLDTDFTSIYWTYATGFPKASNIGKMVDKRNGVAREVVAKSKAGKTAMGQNGGWNDHANRSDLEITRGNSPLEGSYGGFQPKPAVEVIIVAMKPLTEKTFVDQALKNGKGMTWLDDCRIPVETSDDIHAKNPHTHRANNREHSDIYGEYQANDYSVPSGRFPANLLVSDDVLNDGRVTRGTANTRHNNPSPNTSMSGANIGHISYGHADEGSYSRYFDLDAWWAKTFPFLIVPKASKTEKNAGCEALEERLTAGLPMRSADGDCEGIGGDGTATDRVVKMKNHHPTVKPLKLMSYLVTLGSRQNEIVLDPFLGSGTTALAAKQLGRKYLGIELNEEYCEIARKRLSQGTLSVSWSTFQVMLPK